MTTTNTEDQHDIEQNNEGADPSTLKKWMQYIFGKNKWSLWLAGSIAVSIAVLGIFIVLWMFWRNVYAYDGSVKTGFSKNPNDWGAFGSYAGGVLSPFFNFLTFVGLLLTIYIQTRQFKHLQEESKRTDVYRLIKKLVERIDNNYKNSICLYEFTLFDFVRKKVPDNAAYTHGKYLAELKTANKDGKTDVIFKILKDLDRLLDYIKLYETQNGEMHLLNHYQWEYSELMEFLRDNNLLWMVENIYERFQGVNALKSYRVR